MSSGNGRKSCMRCIDDEPEARQSQIDLLEGEIKMPVVDVQFKLTGKLIPVDHGYRLLSAVSEIIPELHAHDGVGIHPIFGRLAGDRTLALTEHSFLTIRLPSEQLAQILPLAGKTIRIGDDSVHIGVPQTRALVPSARLYSHLVIIKGFMEPELFLEAVDRQLQYMEVKGKPSLVMQSHIADSNAGKLSGTHSPYLRRTVKIHDKEIVGFALRVEELTAEESIRLQEKGIGGRRRFGCGIFLPERR
jgi:CRISPR-associated protein Cas6